MDKEGSISMTSKERMIATYRRQKTDRIAVSPEIWSATVLEFKMKPFYKYLGPFADEDYMYAWIETQRHFGFDVWVLSALDNMEESNKYSIKTTAEYINDDLIETRKEIKTIKGDIKWVTRTNMEYDGWGYENPVKQFERDMPAYAAYTMDNPGEHGFAKLKEDMKKVGDDGLLSAYLGDLFISYLAKGRVGDIGRTLMDLCDYEDYIKELHSQYIQYLIAKIQHLSKLEGLKSVCITNGYSNAGIIGPHLYEKWEVPVLEAVAHKAHECGFVVHLHQHGKARQVLNKIADTGIDLVDCLERPSAGGDIYSLKEIKQNIGHKISLKGNIDPINILRNGSTKDVGEQAKECIEAAGGSEGFILSTGDSVVEKTPFRNLEVLFEAAIKY